MTMPPSDPIAFVTFAWPILAAAGVAGTVDAIGGGGGLITVPTLLNCGVPAALLLGTNKTISCLGSLPALFRYRRAGLLPKLTAKEWAVLMLVCALGSIAGAALSQIPAFLARLSAIVPLLLVGVMVFMMKRWFWDERRAAPAVTLGTKDEEPIVHLRTKIGPWLAPLGLGVVGFYDGLLGPGTGTFYLNFLEHFRIRTLTANAMTKVFNFSSNAGALGFFLVMGRGIWLLGLAAALCYSLGNFIGAGLVLRKGQTFVRIFVLLATSSLLVRYIYRTFA